MINLVEEYINTNRLITNEDKILVALSGGMDSIFLLHALLNLKYKIIVAHVNHQKREESLEEERYITEYCNKNNIECYTTKFNYEKNNFHNEAREFRYDFFYKISKKTNCTKIATAHHLDDQLETIILNLYRGSSLCGYSGISNKVKYKDLFIIRPLLYIKKEDIKEYIISNQITYFEDSSNSLDIYKRNMIRNNLIPTLVSIDNNIYNKIQDYNKILYESFQFIRSISNTYLIKWDNKIVIEQFKVLDIAIKKDIITKLLEEFKIEKSFSLIENILLNLMSNKPQVSIDLKNDYQLKKRYDLAYIEETKTSKDIEFNLNLEESYQINDKLKISLVKKVFNTRAKNLKLCYNCIVLPLKVRTRKSKDFIIMPYGKKKIKDLFIDLKVSKEKRDEALLVCDSTDEILMVINYAHSKKLLDMKNNNDDSCYLVIEELQ